MLHTSAYTRDTRHVVEFIREIIPLDSGWVQYRVSADVFIGGKYGNLAHEIWRIGFCWPDATMPATELEYRALEYGITTAVQQAQKV
jgi:hypothetical protein